jgi:hypothetical protein
MPESFSDRLRRIADRLERAWTPPPNLDLHPSAYLAQKDRQRRLLHGAAVEAGALLLEAIDAGAFPDAPRLATIVGKLGIGDGRANAAFLLLWQKWLAPRHPGQFSRQSLGFQYADAMRLFADELTERPARHRRKRAGRKADPAIAERDERWRAEFKAGRGTRFDTIADFARHLDEQYSTVHKAIRGGKKPV